MLDWLTAGATDAGVRAGWSLSTRHERLDRHVDRGGADRLVEIEVVVGAGQLDVLDRRSRAGSHPLDELAHI